MRQHYKWCANYDLRFTMNIEIYKQTPWVYHFIRSLHVMCNIELYRLLYCVLYNQAAYGMIFKKLWQVINLCGIFLYHTTLANTCIVRASLCTLIQSYYSYCPWPKFKSYRNKSYMNNGTRGGGGGWSDSNRGEQRSESVTATHTHTIIEYWH